MVATKHPIKPTQIGIGASAAAAIIVVFPLMAAAISYTDIFVDGAIVIVEGIFVKFGEKIVTESVIFIRNSYNNLKYNKMFFETIQY